ncbi:MAG: hypothetical protein KBG20_04385 [Caldilineaceae bacterium]|nr:hypothetical protein [Caldilineaceae bacterium]MBP8106807.1 hypothetical protein [Caldilineaceae bacterium]MBP8121701.1 hypothetical protein [Caldilineaceae bacterium]MBP9071509.1 hypothetical protein [Caldilineaceae bacterium]
MAAITTIQLLYNIRHACRGSSFVRHVEERVLDIDVLHVRVHLRLPETFINAFYNLATDKTAFALVQAGSRIYGADNAKMGWHYHPFADPSQHIPCPQMAFAEFLQEVENHLVP